MTIDSGETRIVFLIGKYAIKIPNFRKGYRQFLYGLVSNHQEVTYSGKNNHLLPVLFSTWGAFVIVMPRCKVLKQNLSQNEFYEVTKSLGVYPKVDYKPESFGIWKDKIWVIDYGTTI